MNLNLYKPVSYDQVNEMKAQISDTERQLDMAQVDKLIKLTIKIMIAHSELP